VKFNFDRILDPATQSAQSAAMIGPVVSTEVVDEFTFRLTHSAPWARFLDALSEGFVPMWSPTAVQEYGIDFQQHLVGSGPFMLEEYVPADHTTLVKNPDYNWAPAYMAHQGPAMIDRVTLRFISEASTAVAAFQAGEADVVIRFPPARVGEFRGDASIVMQEGEFTGSPVLFVMNTEQPPLDDINVRKALRHAINSEEIVQVLWAGEAIPLRGVMYPASLCYWAEAESVYPFDVEAANALLEEAGWVDSDGDGIREKDGQPLQLTLVNAFVDALGPIVQAQLLEIGVDAQVELVPGPVQLERAAAGDFHTIFQHMAFSDPGVLDMLYNSKNLQPGGWSWTRYQDPELDAILDESAMTVDVAARCELLTQAQQIISDQALALPLYGNKFFAATTTAVQGFGPGPRPNVDIWLYNTSLAE
jgi:peptide/nickel transport system substrate-binding protein